MIPLLLIDLQPVIGETGLVVVSECLVLDDCHWNSALSLFSLTSCPLTLFNSLFLIWIIYQAIQFYISPSFLPVSLVQHLLSPSDSQPPSLTDTLFLIFMFQLLPLALAPSLSLAQSTTDAVACHASCHLWWWWQCSGGAGWVMLTKLNTVTLLADKPQRMLTHSYAHALTHTLKHASPCTQAHAHKYRAKE